MCIRDRINTPKDKLSQSDLYQAIHHELTASASAVKIAHAINPEFQVGCMILSMPIYPLSPDPSDVIEAMQQDHFNTFFADVQVRGEYPKYLNRYFKENDIHIRMTEEAVSYTHLDVYKRQAWGNQFFMVWDFAIRN